MTEENSRPENEPKEKEPQEQETDRVESNSAEDKPIDKTAEDWEREKEQGKEIVSKALNKVKGKLEEQ